MTKEYVMNVVLKTIHKFQSVILFGGCIGIGFSLGLLDKSYADTANLNLTLTIITPPQCTINGGDNMTVSFGEVHQGLIDGVSYKRVPINYTLVCSSMVTNALKMSLSWSGINLNGLSAIQTNRTNLGIAVYKDASRLENGESINFIYDFNAPSLYAAPVKPEGTMLTDAGPFNGSMTMTLNYP